MLSKPIFAAAISAAALAVSSGASRADLPSADYSAGVGGVSYSDAGTYGGPQERVTVAPTPSPFIRAFATDDVVGTGNGAGGRILYYAQLDGPDNMAAVPVDVSYAFSGSTTSSKYGYGESTVDITLDVGGVYYFDGASYTSADGGDSYSKASSWAFTITPGELVLVQLNAQADAAVSFVEYGGTSTSTAYIDPIFTIDPMWAASHPGYSFSFSPGVGNQAATAPEPAAWALLILGFGAMGAALRRRRSLATA